MKDIYEVNCFNKILALLTFEKTKSCDIHIYRIETIKKKDSDLVLPLFRQHFIDITLFLDIDQSYKFMTDGSENTVTSNTLQVLPPFQLNSSIIPKETLQTARGYTLIFSFDFLSIGVEQANFLREFDFLNISNLNNHFPLTVAESEKFVFLFEKMLYEYESNEERSKQILQGYLWVMMNECKKIYDASKPESMVERPIRQSQKLFDSFQNLVATNVRSVHAVENYADMLFVTPNHLTQSIKETSGKSPKEFINERRLIEAKSLLLYTDNSIAEIAYLLNFSEPTHFTKFFKKETGKTPMDFIFQSRN